MPLLGLLLGKINLTEAKFVFVPATASKAEVAFRYGAFLQSVIDFLIIALSIFIVIRFLSRFQRKKEEQSPPPQVSNEEKLLSEIRDILKQKSDKT